MCANHLPDSPDAVHCPDCLSDHPAGVCPLMPVAASPTEGVMGEPELEEELYCPSCDEYGHVEDDHTDDLADENDGEEDMEENVLQPISVSNTGGDFVP